MSDDAKLWLWVMVGILTAVICIVIVQAVGIQW